MKPLPPERTPDEVRDTIKRLANERSESLAALSRMVRKNDGYLQQFVAYGIPRRLPDDARRLLALYFGVTEHELGASA
jgi:repressor LexA